MAVTVDNTKGAYTIPALSGSGYVPIGGGTMTGALTIASGTLTASAPALNITQTFNNAAVAFDADTTSVTNTASMASTSTLKKWVVNGTTVASVYPSGLIKSEVSSVQGYNVEVHDTAGAFSWAGGSLSLFRDAAGVLAQRNGTNAQTLRVYGSYTDSSNYERLSLSTTAGSGVTIAAETLGTGGDNLDIVLTPAGSGRTKMSGGLTLTSGGLLLSGFGSGLDNYASGLRLGNAGEVAWCVSAGNSAVDTAFLRGAAGQVDVTNGTAATYRDLKLRNLLNTEYHQMTEMTAPSAPATNSVRIYAEDNGSGKTRLMALFATGAAQQISIEP